MSKIKNDKYYTPIDLANYCWDKVLEIVGEENITEIIEPSVGDGSFLHHRKEIPHFAYDIEPECESNFTKIFKQDFLKTDIKYLEGRLIIGNPPYGNYLNLAQKFYKKSVEIADIIAFILPISQLNNSNSLYEFDLIHSEDIGIRSYSGVNLHCCFNIYKRPKSRKLNKKNNYKLNDVTLIEYRRDGKVHNIPNNYDYAIGTYGAGCVGKEIKNIGQYSIECYFYINNKKIKDEVLKLIKTTDWKKLSKGISNNYRLPQWRIYKHIKDNIKDIN